MINLFTPTGEGYSEVIIKKSRFIGMAVPCERVELCRNLVEEKRRAHPRSRHVAWACVLGRTGTPGGLSDDGEPHGTAGRPILHHIEGARITNVLVIVVRYFGGVKLGTGGLVAAYGRSAKDALETMPHMELVARRVLKITLSYNLHEAVVRVAQEAGGTIEKELFDTEIQMHLILPEAVCTTFTETLANATRGMAHISDLGPMPDNTEWPNMPKADTLTV